LVGDLGVHPCRAVGEPVFHPVDFGFPCGGDVPVGPDIGAEDAPALEVAFLGFVEKAHGVVDVL